MGKYWRNKPLVFSLLPRSHLPLRTWFLAIYLLTKHDQRKSPRDMNGVSALSLRRQLGVNANTAWLIKHKLMQTMIERDDAKPLAGIVQLDDAYWGRERHGGATGRGSPGKTPWPPVQITAHGFPLAMRMDVVPSFRKTALAQWAKRHLAPGTAGVSDGLNCFPGVTAADCTHVPLITGGGAASAAHPMFMWVNTVLGNVKNALHGTYDQRKSPRDHALKPKYLQTSRCDAGLACHMRVIAAHAGPQHPALHGDRPHLPMPLDEGVLHFAFFAKYAFTGRVRFFGYVQNEVESGAGRQSS